MLTSSFLCFNRLGCYLKEDNYVFWVCPMDGCAAHCKTGSGMGAKWHKEKLWWPRMNWRNMVSNDLNGLGLSLKERVMWRSISEAVELYCYTNLHIIIIVYCCYCSAVTVSAGCLSSFLKFSAFIWQVQFAPSPLCLQIAEMNIWLLQWSTESHSIFQDFLHSFGRWICLFFRVSLVAN